MNKFGTVNIVLIENPFEIEKRKNFLEIHGEKLKDYFIGRDLKDFYISVNGKETNDYDLIIEKGDFILIIPIIAGGSFKSIIGLIAMVALAVYAPQLAINIGQYSPGIYGGVNGLMAFKIVQAGIMVAGSLAISALTAPSIPSNNLANSETESKTYTWSGISTTAEPNKVIPEIFGTHAVGGNKINQRITGNAENSYFYMLLALGRGEYDLMATDGTKFTDANTQVPNIRLNDDIISSYDDVYYEFRDGSHDQSVIDWFPGSTFINAKNALIEETDDWVYFETDSTEIDKANVFIEFPNGLYSLNSAGNLQEQSVAIEIEIKESGGDWLPFNEVEDLEYDSITTESYNLAIANKNKWESLGMTVSFNSRSWNRNEFDYGTIYTVVATRTTNSYIFEEKNRNALRFVLESSQQFNNTQIEIRLRRISDDVDDLKISDKLYLSGIEEVTTERQNYGGIALLALKFLASDELSQEPTVSTVITRKDLTLDGVAVPSDTPSAIIEYIAKDVGVSENNIDYAQLENFQDFTDNFGNRLAFNGVFDSTSNAFDTMQTVAYVGRGQTVLKGSNYSVLFDEKIEDNILKTLPLFTSDNTTDVSMSYIGQEDIMNYYEVSFMDKELDYNMSQVTVIDSNSNINKVNKRTDTVIGITTEQEAIVYAKYLLDSSKYLKRTIEFKTNIEALSLLVGDVFQYQSDVLQNGITSVSLGEVGFQPSLYVVIKLRDTIELGVGSYVARVRKQDGSVVEYYLYDNNTTTDEIKLSTTQTTLGINEGDILYIGELTQPLYFKATDISREEDFICTIRALEYNNTILDLNYDNDKVQTITRNKKAIANIRDLIVDERLVKKPDGSVVTIFDISWVTDSDASTYNLYVYTGSRWRKRYKLKAKGLKTNYYSFEQTDMLENNTYKFKVECVENKPDYSLIYHEFLGKLTPPDPIDNLVASNTLNEVTLTWDYEEPLDFAKYKIYYNGTFVKNVTEKEYKTTITTPVTFEIKAQDTSGIVSDGVELLVNTVILPTPDSITVEVN